MEERRRSQRHVMQSGESAGLPGSASVQVLDISVAGVLLQSSRLVRVGLRGSLRLSIGGQSFTTDVAVARVSTVSVGADPRYRIGAAFISMAPEHRQLIERFTHQ
jgi:hypothetical protein